MKKIINPKTRSTKDCFETNCNPWTHMGHFSGSSSVNLWYSGAIVTDRNNAGDTTETESQVWYFDSLHSQYPYETDTPKSARFGDYEGKTTFGSNERLDDDWLKSVKGSENADIIAKEFNSDYNATADPNPLLTESHRITKDFIEFGITHRIPVRIFNDSDTELTFQYEVDNHRFDLYGTSWTEDNISTSYKGQGYEEGTQTIEVRLNPHEWTEIELNTNLLTSGTAEMRHIFKILKK